VKKKVVIVVPLSFFCHGVTSMIEHGFVGFLFLFYSQQRLFFSCFWLFVTMSTSTQVGSDYSEKKSE